MWDNTVAKRSGAQIKEATMRVLVLVLALMLLSSPSSAFSGNRLKEYCNDPPHTILTGFCGGYIMAVAHVLASDEITGWSACIPQGREVTNRRLIDVAKKFLNDNPELRHLAAQSLVAMALSKAFPCSE